MGEFIPYPAIGRHGVVGDRRTAALVAADGTADWLCLPDYDSAPFFSALLDAPAGGFWRLGPARLRQGRQRYEGDTAVLTTEWQIDGGRLELTDAMLWPEDQRTNGRDGERVLLRRLRCHGGSVDCVSSLRPSPEAAARPQVWFAGALAGTRDERRFVLANGEELWAVLATSREEWTPARCRQSLDEVLAYWRDFAGRLRCAGPRRAQEARAGITIHLLAYAPDGSVVAAPTSSLPERVGGSWNADYRLSWVRDASLSVGALAKLGDLASAQRFLGWLERRSDPATLAAPLFTIHGERAAPVHRLEALSGYRSSRPVVFGNHAYAQRQIGSIGFLADCAWTYVRLGGSWNETDWRFVRVAANHVAATWSEPDNSLWELSRRGQYVSSRVMSWVALDRASKLARRCGDTSRLKVWSSVMDAIHAEVASRGWSARLGAFRQRYDEDNLDAAALLIPIMGFLPYDDPRVVRTIERIADHLTIDELTYRFEPERVPALSDEDPMGSFEGAFLPCTCWLATAYVGLGRDPAAERILARVDEVAGGTGLLAEAVDPRDGTFLGNMPLLFSHSEYLRAVHALRHHDD
ncbi:MAG TPA: glycoside hydrolase family 15 protein [Polyangia bacterium]|nr:glycoside hydrolase family 15 protein [Polyangia bacterium]